MRRARLISAFCILHSAFVLPTAVAGSDAPRDSIAQGNVHYAAGRFSAALEAYDKAAAAADASMQAEVLHDRAAALFKLGKIDEAREVWVRAASLKDSRFEAAARYNLGNCHYAAALHALEQATAGGSVAGPQPVDVSSILQTLDAARDQYLDAIRLDPTLTNARANLELALQLKRQIEQNTTTQPSSQPSKKKDKQQSSQPSDQQQQDQQGDEQDQQQDQSSSKPSPDQKSATQPSEQDQQQQNDQKDEQDKRDEQKEKEQNAAQTQPAQTQPAASQPQEAKPQPQSPDAKDQDQSKDRQTIQLKLTPEQAEQLMQKIRELEHQRRQMLLQRERAKHKPVDKDW